jgi:hypothetical protein
VVVEDEGHGGEKIAGAVVAATDRFATTSR